MSFLRNLKVGFFLASRYLKKSNLWLTILLIFIMMLTFLNLIVINGFLIGLIDGSYNGFNKYNTGDLIVKTSDGYSYIENSQEIIKNLDNINGVIAYSPRYEAAAIIEPINKGLFKERNQKDSTISAVVFGIDPALENNVTFVHERVIEGEFLEPGDTDVVVVGANLFKRYFPIEDFTMGLLGDVYVGDEIFISINNHTKKYRIKGIIKTKDDRTDFSILMPASDLRQTLNQFDYNISEIAIRIDISVTDAETIKSEIIAIGISESAKVEVSGEAIGKFLDDIKETFSILGTLIGTIGLIVSSITVFIVIFIMALTRQKLIGILKGLGISESAIIYTYTILSLLFAFLGSLIAFLLIVFLIKPYFDANPIDFPFSDGILSVSNFDYVRASILIFLTTLIAGILPAHIIVKKNTLDSILGR